MLLTACALDEVDTPENRPPPGWSVEGALDGCGGHGNTVSAYVLDEVDAASR
jgi:hypothetical protein